MKVTSALEMVSASKIRKSQDLMNATRPYARMMRRISGSSEQGQPGNPSSVYRSNMKR